MSSLFHCSFLFDRFICSKTVVLCYVFILPRPVYMRVVGVYNCLFMRGQFYFAGAISINGQIQVEIFLILGVVVSFDKTDILPRLEFFFMEESSCIDQNRHHFSDVSLVAEHAQFKSSVRVSIVSVVVGLEGSFGSVVHLERVISLIMDCYGEVAPLSLRIFG